VRRRGLLSSLRAPWPATVVKVPWRTAYETGAVFWALAVNLVGLRRLSSRYRGFDFPAGRDDAVSRGRRSVALRHELDPKRSWKSMP
jgi:hypothetical protein